MREGEPKRRGLVGPSAPPTPAEVDGPGVEPMAVASDKATLHGEGFVPTTASRDAFDADVAEKFRDPQLRRRS